MKLSIYAIKDHKSTFMLPTFDSNDATALRNFKFAVNNPESLMNFAVRDFSLYRIGMYDNESGEITGYDHVLIAHAGDVLDE